MHEVLVNRLGGLSLPRKSVVRLTDRPDMTLDVYRGRKTTIQQQQCTNRKKIVDGKGNVSRTTAIKEKKSVKLQNLGLCFNDTVCKIIFFHSYLKYWDIFLFQNNKNGSDKLMANC